MSKELRGLWRESKVPLPHVALASHKLGHGAVSCACSYALLRAHSVRNLQSVSTVQEILAAMDKMTRDELRVVKLGVDSRLTDDDDDPALLASLREAIAYADTHRDEAKSIDEVRALIPQWISESKSQTRP